MTSVSHACNLLFWGSGSGRARGAMASPTHFGKYVNSIPVKGTDHAHYIAKQPTLTSVSNTCNLLFRARGSGRATGAMAFPEKGCHNG